MTLKTEDLAQFYGTENWYRYEIFGRYLFTYTDGVRHVAREGEAYWLIQAIAAHFVENPKIRAAEFLIWELKVTNRKAVLTAKTDSNAPLIVNQRIPFTDFPLSEIKFYMEEGGPDGKKVLCLPSER